MQLSENYLLRFLSNASFFVISSFLLSLNHGTVKAAALSELQNVNYRSEKTCEKFCQTETCFEMSSFYSKIMNQEADPCENFYEFACGNFTKNENIPDDETNYDLYIYVRNIVLFQVLEEIGSPIQQNEPSAFKKSKTYYQNCMNTTHIEEEGTKPIFRVLEKIGGWPILLGNKWNEDSFNWVETYNKIIDARLKNFFPFIVEVEIHAENSSKSMLRIDPARTIIIHDKYFKDYFDFILKIGTELGADKNKIREEVHELFLFELCLHQITTWEDVYLNETLSDNQMTIKELSEKYSSIPWLKLINKILSRSGVSVTENETIVVKNSNFISKLEKFLKITPKRAQANFMVWKVVQTMLEYLPKKFQEIKSNFTNNAIGTKGASSREKECLFDMIYKLLVSLNAMYVRKYFNKDIKNNIIDLVQNIKNQTRKNLEIVDWMDEKTREAALEKLDAMDAFVGYANEWMDDDKINDYYKNLEISSGNYLESMLNLSAFEDYEIYKEIGKSFDKNSWINFRSALFDYAVYSFRANRIEIYPPILRKPFFQHDNPQYLNYGAIGTIIGHEITHVVDYISRNYDKNGNYENWWQPETEKKYLEKAQCIIDQYNNFTVSEVNLTINGIKTLSENVADIEGYKVAYYAYNEWAGRNNIEEDCLPSIKYTPKQMFWISAASRKCSKERPEYLRGFIEEEMHSLPNARIILPFSNIKEFAEDFNCKPNSKMNPEKKCVIW